MSALEATGPGRPIGPRAAAGHALTVTRRNLIHVRNDPEQLLDAVLMPIVFVLMFVYVFGGAIAGSGRAYVQFLLPGAMLQTAAFAAMRTGIGLSVDFERGIVDRFRSLPIARSALLTGRILADTARLVLSLAVTFAVGAAIGFRVRTGVLPALAAFGLLILIGAALSWVSAYIGVAGRSAEMVQQLGFLWLIPLTFGSSIFAPASSMPGWLQAWVKVNPMTLASDAARGLLSGGPVASPALQSLAWVVGIIAVFAPLAVDRYRRRT
jgi:oleandomycin transport system permease protein